MNESFWIFVLLMRWQHQEWQIIDRGHLSRPFAWRCWKMSFIASKLIQRAPIKYYIMTNVLWDPLCFDQRSLPKYLTSLFDSKANESILLPNPLAPYVCRYMYNPTPLQQCCCEDRSYCVLGYRPEFVIETLSIVVGTAVGLATSSMHLVLFFNSVVQH